MGDRTIRNRYIHKEVGATSVTTDIVYKISAEKLEVVEPLAELKSVQFICTRKELSKED